MPFTVICTVPSGAVAVWVVVTPAFALLPCASPPLTLALRGCLERPRDACLEVIPASFLDVCMGFDVPRLLLLPNAVTLVVSPAS